MKINQFSQQGKRSNNEDCLGITQGLLTVCDGMGGHNFGERASAFVKEAMVQAFVSPRPLNKMDIQQQLTKVQTDLNQLLETEPELEKMGTTFTGVFITPDVWYAAHIGDSRIYLFRPSEKKLWHTWDHSLVGELMRTKEITVEAGRFHPMSNRIAKAIIAKRDGKTASASIVKIDQLKKGDIFLLCSDGVVEGWGDLELVKLFSDTSLTFDQKCQKLSEQCNEKSKDNNTAIIAEIEESDTFNYGKNDELDWTTFAEVEADYNKYVKDNSEEEEEEAKPAAANTPNNPQVFIDPTPYEEPPTPTETKENHKSKQNLRAILIAFIALAIVALCFLLKPSSKPEVDPDTEAFNNCTTVGDYRNYMADFGKNGIHYAEAKAVVEAYVADSIAEAEERMEYEMYINIVNIEDCENYLAEYPFGRYVEPVSNKMAALQEQKAELDAISAELEATQAALKAEQTRVASEAAKLESNAREEEAKQKEDEAFNNCENIPACDFYLKAYPKGRYVKEVKAKKTKLEKEAKSGTPDDVIEEEKDKKGVKTEETKIEEQVESKSDNIGKQVGVPKTESFKVGHVTFAMKKQVGETSGLISDKPVSQALWLTMMGGDQKYAEWGNNSDSENTPAVVEDENEIKTFVSRLNSMKKKKFSYQKDDTTGGFYLILNSEE